MEKAISIVLVLVLTLFADDGKSQQCLVCHEIGMAGIVKQWRNSKHSNSGVSCEACHLAWETILLATPTMALSSQRFRLLSTARTMPLAAGYD